MLFSGLSILKETDFCERVMGRFPVLALSFNGIEGNFFSEAYGLLGLTLAEAARGFECLLGSPRLNAQDKADLLQFQNDRFMMNSENKALASRFIARLSAMLEKYFGVPVVLLIDEYDVSLAKASSGGYYEEMRYFYKVLLSVLKTGVGRAAVHPKSRHDGVPAHLEGERVHGAQQSGRQHRLLER